MAGKALHDCARSPTLPFHPYLLPVFPSGQGGSGAGWSRVAGPRCTVAGALQVPCRRVNPSERPSTTPCGAADPQVCPQGGRPGLCRLRGLRIALRSSAPLKLAASCRESPAQAGRLPSVLRRCFASHSRTRPRPTLPRIDPTLFTQSVNCLGACRPAFWQAGGRPACCGRRRLWSDVEGFCVAVPPPRTGFLACPGQTCYTCCGVCYGSSSFAQGL